MIEISAWYNFSLLVLVYDVSHVSCKLVIITCTMWFKLFIIYMYLHGVVVKCAYVRLVSEL